MVVRGLREAQPHQAGLSGVCRVLQSGTAVPSDRENLRPVSRAGCSSDEGSRVSRGIARARRIAARLPNRRVGGFCGRRESYRSNAGWRFSSQVFTGSEFGHVDGRTRFMGGTTSGLGGSGEKMLARVMVPDS